MNRFSVVSSYFNNVYSNIYLELAEPNIHTRSVLTVWCIPHLDVTLGAALFILVPIAQSTGGRRGADMEQQEDSCWGFLWKKHPSYDENRCMATVCLSRSTSFCYRAKPSLQNRMCYVTLKGSRRLGKVTKVSGSEKRDREAKRLN